MNRKYHRWVHTKTSTVPECRHGVEFLQECKIFIRFPKIVGSGGISQNSYRRYWSEFLQVVGVIGQNSCRKGWYWSEFLLECMVLAKILYSVGGIEEDFNGNG